MNVIVIIIIIIIIIYCSLHRDIQHLFIRGRPDSEISVFVYSGKKKMRYLVLFLDVYNAK